MNSSPEKIAETLRKFREENRTVLFAGAGVSARIGMPVWPQLLSSLSDHLYSVGKKGEAEVMRDRVSEGDYLGAASVYKTCKAVDEGERFRKIAEPFRDTNIDPDSLRKLEPIVAYPNASIVTTNYDRALFSAAAKFRQGVPPLEVEVDDPMLLRGVATSSTFSIVRLHGRAELPSSLMLSDDDYRKIGESSDYRDFAFGVFEHSSVIFVGFSFLDPAIESILRLYEKQFRPNFPNRHIALLPEADSSKSLAIRLSELGISCVFFSPENNYRDLWHGFRLWYDKMQIDSAQGNLVLDSKPSKIEDLRRPELAKFISFVFAQSNIPASRGESLSSAVKEGLVLSIINNDVSSMTQEVTIIAKVREILRLEESEAEKMVDSTLTALEEKKLIRRGKRVALITEKVPDDANRMLEQVADSILTRGIAIYGANKAIRDQKSQVIVAVEKVLLERAWDLSASYAGASLEPEECDVSRVVKRMVSNELGHLEAKDLDALIYGFCDVLRNPSESDSSALSQLGRAAIAVQLALTSPRSALLNRSALPDILYFDASILMPAIVDGHPLHRGYLSAIRRLLAAKRKVGGVGSSKIGRHFLSEIIHHRREALDLIQQTDLEKPDALQKYVSYVGSTFMNVYVSGYASTVLGSEKDHISFRQYLNRAAPYETIDDLAAYLDKLYKIETVDLNPKQARVGDFNVVFSDLKEAYEDLARKGRRLKRPNLIRHEAHQLCQLGKDALLGQRSLFVSADMQLQRCVAMTDRIRNLASSIVSGVGFLGLVDLVVGLEPDPTLFTKLVWGFPRRKADQHARDYIVSEVVAAMNENLLIPLPELLPKVIAARAQEIEAANDAGRNGSSGAKKVLKLVDDLKKDYLAAVEVYVAKRREDYGPGAI